HTGHADRCHATATPPPGGHAQPAHATDCARPTRRPHCDAAGRHAPARESSTQPALTEIIPTVLRYRASVLRSASVNDTAVPTPGDSSRYEYGPIVSDVIPPTVVGAVSVRSTMLHTTATTSGGTSAHPWE